MKAIPSIIFQASVFALLCHQQQLSVANPQYYDKHNNHGHRHHGHGRQQQQQQQQEWQEQTPPTLCQSGEGPKKPAVVPPQEYQQPDPNFQGPPLPALNISPQLPPKDPKVQPPTGGIQILPPQEPPKGDLNPIVWKQPQSSPCPEGSGTYKKTGLCYKFANPHLAAEELSPCTSSFMEFFKINGTNPPIGDCDCKVNHLGVERPIAYWAKSDDCFWLFSQGPCQAEEWLVLSENDEPVCNKRSCPENTLEEWNPTEGSKKYWFRYRGKCIKSDEKGFCEDNPELKIYLRFNKTEKRYAPECKAIGMQIKTLLNGAKPLPCQPGHKNSATGECRQAGSFE